MEDACCYLWFCLNNNSSFDSLFQTAEKDELEDMQKELQKVAHPIMTKLYRADNSAPGGATSDRKASSDYSESGSGPTIEEVD